MHQLQRGGQGAPDLSHCSLPNGVQFLAVLLPPHLPPMCSSKNHGRKSKAMLSGKLNVLLPTLASVCLGVRTGEHPSYQEGSLQSQALEWKRKGKKTRRQARVQSPAWARCPKPFKFCSWRPLQREVLGTPISLEPRSIHFSSLFPDCCVVQAPLGTNTA